MLNETKGMVMYMKEIEFQIEINASKGKIWATLWNDITFRDWANMIDEGTYMKGVLKEGNEIQFMSSVNGYGVTSLIEKLKLNEFILLKHVRDTIESGQEERENEWTGGRESYLLSEKNTTTVLIFKADIPQELEESMKVRYHKAFDRVKILAEKVM